MGYDEATQQAVVTDIPLRGKRLFIREDFNVPMDKQGHITDDTRIKAALPTIRYAIAGDAKVILASHLGQPVGKPDSRYSLRPVAQRLPELLGQEVMMAEDCIGPAVKALVAQMRKGNVLLPENLRFHAGEEQNDPGFAQHLARPADIYVNDAFGTAHRAHASTKGITKFISAAVAGLLMQAELNHLGELLATPLYHHLGRGEGVGQDRPDPAPAVQVGSGADRRRDGLCIS
jgi:phosphoglycerate kinase